MTVVSPRPNTCLKQNEAQMHICCDGTFQHSANLRLYINCVECIELWWDFHLLFDTCILPRYDLCAWLRVKKQQMNLCVTPIVSMNCGSLFEEGPCIQGEGGFWAGPGWPEDCHQQRFSSPGRGTICIFICRNCRGYALPMHLMVGTMDAEIKVRSAGIQSCQRFSVQPVPSVREVTGLLFIWV